MQGSVVGINCNQRDLNVYRLGYDVCIHTVAKWFTPTLSTAKTIAEYRSLYRTRGVTLLGPGRSFSPDNTRLPIVRWLPYRK